MATQTLFITICADGFMAYQATKPGGLRELFDVVKRAPELISRSSN
jgi:hypothetical protein